MGNNAISSLPAQVSELVHIKVLDLFNNRLSSLPPQIGHMKQLEKLRLGSNRLTHLPDEISELENLFELDISRNDFSELPLVVCSLVHLQFLNASGNRISLLPERFTNLRVLQFLDLSFNEGLAIVQPVLTRMRWVEVQGLEEVLPKVASKKRGPKMITSTIPSTDTSMVSVDVLPPRPGSSRQIADTATAVVSSAVNIAVTNASRPSSPQSMNQMLPPIDSVAIPPATQQNHQQQRQQTGKKAMWDEDEDDLEQFLRSRSSSRITAKLRRRKRHKDKALSASRSSIVSIK